MSILEVSELRVTYGSGRNTLHAVDGVDLALPAGQTLGLVGESGSGKSTIARAIVGLAPISRGRVLLDGVDVTHPKEQVARTLHRRVQMIFQDPYSSLNPRMTVAETITEAIVAHHDMRRDQRRARVEELLRLVSMDPASAGSYPHQFSGGQRQRIAIARALAVEPDIVIADEITSPLDVSVQAAVLNVLRDIQQRLGLTMLFISHNLAVVRYMSHRIAVTHLGKIVETAARDDLFSHPQHPYTRTLLDALPTLRLPDSSQARPEWVQGDIPDPHHPPSGCRFHTRCPVGPLADPVRTLCSAQEPVMTADVGGADLAGGQDMEYHGVACHFPLGRDELDRHVDRVRVELG